MKISTLHKEDILKLISLLKDDFERANTRRSSEPLSKHIQYPKIPSILSESIVKDLLIKKKLLSELTTTTTSTDHSKADILIHTQHGIKTVEVKSTGESAFQNFGEKDINADYIIWLHFNDLFKDRSAESFEVFIIDNPKRYFLKPVKITLSSVKKIVPDLRSNTFKLTEL